MPPTSAFRRPPGRYDDRRPLPKPAVVALLAGLGVALLIGTYAAWDRYSSGRVPFSVLGYEVLSDQAVEVRFEVHKAPSSTVTCLVRARGRDGGFVASEQVEVGPSQSGPVRVTHRLTTSARAVNGEVARCRP
jgi:hypothetical protein